MMVIAHKPRHSRPHSPTHVVNIDFTPVDFILASLKRGQGGRRNHNNKNNKNHKNKNNKNRKYQGIQHTITCSKDVREKTELLLIGFYLFDQA